LPSKLITRKASDQEPLFPIFLMEGLKFLILTREATLLSSIDDQNDLRFGRA
jgi:hypothetical protein